MTMTNDSVQSLKKTVAPEASGGGEKILLSAEEVSAQLARGATMLDVRRPDEYAHGHIAGSRLMPLDEIEKHAHELEGKNTILICASGVRASEAKSKLEALGLEGLRVLEKGLQAWKEANLPLEQASKVLPLERQVRIAAGSLALAGALLGLFVNLHFLWLSAFVGAGLIFAGVTDTCGMALLLAKMPWNRKRV
jgi:rhodanese-related sulfurtransferase